MSTFTVFHTYTPLDFITNTNLNGNILNIVTAGNAIDRTNMQSGSGIDASSMNPASAGAATFGGSLAYTFAPGFNLTGSFTYGSLAFNGGAIMAAELDLTGTTVTAGQVAIGRDNGATHGLLLNVPSGSTNGFDFGVNGTNYIEVMSTGVLSTGAAGSIGGAVQVSPTINSATVQTWVPPLFTTATGTTAAATAHKEFGVTATLAGAGSVVIALTGNAAFTSSGSYVVVCTPIFVEPTSAGAAPPVVTMTSGTSFTITNGSSGGSHKEYGVSWMAVGT